MQRFVRCLYAHTLAVCALTTHILMCALMPSLHTSTHSAAGLQVRAELLQGSPVLEEARQRQSALQQQWATLSTAHFAADPQRFPPGVWNEGAFMRSFCVVLSCTSYLPSAECFALVPVACSMGHTGNDNGCVLDYDADSSTVKVVTTRPYRCGGGGEGGGSEGIQVLRFGMYCSEPSGWSLKTRRLQHVWTAVAPHHLSPMCGCRA